MQGMKQLVGCPSGHPHWQIVNRDGTTSISFLATYTRFCLSLLKHQGKTITQVLWNMTYEHARETSRYSIVLKDLVSSTISWLANLLDRGDRSSLNYSLPSRKLTYKETHLPNCLWMGC